MRYVFDSHTGGASVPTPLHTRPTPRIALIIPALNEAENLARLIPALFRELAGNDWNLEAVVVDDGSEDDTAAQIDSLARHYPVSLVQLSRNFGKESAISAGLAYTDADAVIIMDADGQHPPAIARQFIVQWQQGYDVVIGQRQHRNDDPLWRQAASGLFYRMVQRSSRLPIVSGAGDFRLLDRRVVDVLNALPENDRFMKGLYTWAGFRCSQVPYAPQPRAHGESRFDRSGLTSLALSALTSFGHSPLRPLLLLGFMLLLPAFIWTGINGAEQLLGSHAPGSTQWIGAILLWVVGLQLASLGIAGEYLHRILRESKRRPGYVVSNQQDYFRRATEQQTESGRERAS